MRPAHLATIFSTLLLTTQACKCLVDRRVNKDVTFRCCANLNGIFVNSNDCNAHSISERLSNFAHCCNRSGLVSDCKFPREAEIGGDEAEGEEEGAEEGTAEGA
ncbi:hypothetical protein PMIN06_011373 [Paraphaeosphaeria minitans]